MKETIKAFTNMLYYNPFMDDNCSDITGLIGLCRYWDWSASALTTRAKGIVSQYFCRFFSWITSPQAPENNIRAFSKFLHKFAEIFANQGASPVSTTPAANFATRTAGVVDTSGKLLSKCFRYLAFCFWKAEGARNPLSKYILYRSGIFLSSVSADECKLSTQEFLY